MFRKKQPSKPAAKRTREVPVYRYDRKRDCYVLTDEAAKVLQEQRSLESK